MKETYSLIGDEYLSEDMWHTVEIQSGTKEERINALEKMTGPWGSFNGGQYMHCKVVKQKDVMKHMKMYEW